MSHSKRNTTRPVFTAHERALARAAWTSSSARLTRDSFLPFGSCNLCLEPARDPVSCHRGDVFCRECALANLLAQKKEIKRLARARDVAEKEVEAVRGEREAEAKVRAVKEFEMVQLGLATRRAAADRDDGGGGGLGGRAGGEDGGKAPAGLLTQGTKRKFDLDEKEVDRISKEDVNKARRALDAEIAQKPTLPSFWTPSLTPTIDPETALSSRKKPKDSPICPCSPSDAPHVLSQKHLVTVLFTEERDPSSSLARAVKRICPCCRKTLSNPSKPVLAKPCGHVLCRACAVRLVESARADADAQGGEGEEEGVLTCYVCDADLSERKKDMKKKNKSGAEDGTEDVDVDPAPAPAGKRAKLQLPATLIELRSDGTGFVAGGGNVVERDGTNFQC